MHRKYGIRGIPLKFTFPLPNILLPRSSRNISLRGELKNKFRPGEWDRKQPDIHSPGARASPCSRADRGRREHRPVFISLFIRN